MTKLFDIEIYHHEVRMGDVTFKRPDYVSASEWMDLWQEFDKLLEDKKLDELTDDPLTS